MTLHNVRAEEELSPVPLMQLSAGFWSFKTLAAAVELELFTCLAGGVSMTAELVSAKLGIGDRPADVFLTACASLGLLDKDGAAYRNSRLAEEFLVPGRPHYFGGLITYLDRREYLPWHNIIDALRQDSPVTWDPATQDSLFSAADPELVWLFSEAMHSLASYTAVQLGERYDFGKHRRLLDVGGGSGIFPIVLCGRHRHLQASVFDLPHACQIAEAKIEEADLGTSVDTIPGDFLADPALPAGYDVILLSSVLHDWDSGTNRALIRKCWEALPADGCLVICELLLNAERTGPAAAALMGMNMLSETEGGRNYSVAEYTAWLTEAGFTDLTVIPISAPSCNGALVARKPVVRKPVVRKPVVRKPVVRKPVVRKPVVRKP